jgi:hypothetical protein
MPTKTASSETTPSFLNILRGARADVRTFVERGINAAEKRTSRTAKALFRFARSVTKRLGGTKLHRS